jgi:prepilin-type N-terminal cleavage/methylation domain-containing protein
MKSEKGFSLLEVMLAVALIGIIAVALLLGLGGASRTMSIADERATAESLARSQMEYIKNQPYSDVQWYYEVDESNRTVHSGQPSWWDPPADPPLLSSDYAGYSVRIEAEDFDADGDEDIEVPGEDEGIREIIITVYHHGKLIATTEEGYTLKGYKVDR